MNDTNKIPADKLASNVIGMLILAEGNLNKYQLIIEGLIKEIRKEYGETS